MTDAIFSPARGLRFGMFELDVRTGNLRKGRARVQLPDQAREILEALIERPGEVVTREHLRQRLWGEHTFVDFEHALNAAVRRLRRTLGDAAGTPRFVETIPRHGYRFVAPVAEVVPESRQPAATVSDNGGTSTTASRRLQIAILPFRPADAGTVAAGIAGTTTEILTTRLGTLRQIAVRPLNAVAQYSDVHEDPGAIARALRVDALVGGRVQVVGDRVSVMLEVLDGETGGTRWSHTLDQRSSELPEIQDRIAEAVAGVLAPALDPEDCGRLRTSHTRSLAAYQLYAEGRRFWTFGSAESMCHAVELFQQAIAKDAAFALAFAGLADALCLLGQQAMVPPRDAWPRATEAAMRALELDDRLAEAHAALGMVNFTYEWNWLEAEHCFLRALALNPNSAAVHLQFAMYLYATGRLPDAAREIRTADDLDPISPIVKIMRCHGLMFSRRADEHLRRARELVAACPGHPLVHAVVGRAFESFNRYDDAVAEFRRAVELTRDGGTMALLGRGYAVAGRHDAARALVAELEARNGREYVPWYRLAFVHMALEDRDRASACLERAYETRDPGIVWAQVDPQFDDLRNDPRAAALVGRLGFPPTAP